MSAPICVHCITGDRLPGEPRGKTEKIGPYETYIATPKEPRQGAETHAVVSLTDVFGLGLVNNKIYADLLADDAGIAVYVPDLFGGKPLNSDNIKMPQSTKEAESQTYFTKITFALKMIPVLPWLFRNWPTGKYTDTEKFIETLRKEKSIEKIGTTSFCYGSNIAVHLSANEKTQAAVMNHPSLLSFEQHKTVKSPTLYNCAETDDQFTPKLRQQVQTYLDGNAQAPAHDFKVFENTFHGFACRPNFADEQVRKGFEEALGRTSWWFKTHL